MSMFQFVHCVILLLFSGSIQAQDEPGEPLFLTPLIQAGEIGKAMEAAKVINFFPNVTSFSGFITVNEEYNSNIFFWFFPATENASTAPVILWSDGGPGISGFFSVFFQNGPFKMSGGNVSLNPHSWHSKYNMIYMDNPVDVGFSFTENEDGYIVSGDEAARDIYQFLTQFFQMFPHLQENPFYNAGVSYGGIYAINAAYYIHLQNQGNPMVNINLTGVIADSPWIDPYTQSDYGNYLYHVGLISEETKEDFIEKETEIRSLINQGSYLDAFKAQIQLTQADVFRLVGYGVANIYDDQYLANADASGFVTTNSIRQALHVGGSNFSWVSPTQQARMHPNFMKSAKPQLDLLLKEGYRFMVYVGNMDSSTGHIGIEKMLKSMTWEGASDLLTGEKEIWKIDNRVAGYVKSSGDNATFVIIRNAGHGCTTDKPEAVLDAVMRFTSGGESSGVK